MGKKNRETTEKKQAGTKRRGFWIGGLVIALVIGLFAWGWVGTKEPSRFSNSEPKASSSYVRRETRIPLAPTLFVGKTATAYRVAQEIPDVLDRLYCYCECDKHMGHLTLLSCFVDSHAAT